MEVTIPRKMVVTPFIIAIQLRDKKKKKISPNQAILGH